MAVGDFPFPDMLPVPGVKLGTASAGIKKPGKIDMVLLELAEGSQVAGVFTRNIFCAAPVTLCKQHLQKSEIRYLLINSGNANACTGDAGMADAMTCCQILADQVGGEAHQVLPFSTGVIGERLPLDKMLAALPHTQAALTSDGWLDAARGIMTTDTRPKGASISFEHNGETIVVNGIAKGAGMIKPNMATMLGFVATNARVSEPVLQTMLTQAVNQSFNRITVDGDTSTNDSCILIASGVTGLDELTSTEGEYYEKLSAAVNSVHQHLAHSIVSDGEGATKFVTVQVQGSASSEEALKVAYSVAQSPLVKTALFACDPNWGRIVAAIGYADTPGLVAESINVWLNDVIIVANGGRATTYREEDGQAVMDGDRILIRIDLGRGDCSETVWTTDLSHEYVTINAEYRT